VLTGKFRQIIVAVLIVLCLPSVTALRYTYIVEPEAYRIQLLQLSFLELQADTATANLSRVLYNLHIQQQPRAINLLSSHNTDIYLVYNQLDLIDSELSAAVYNVESVENQLATVHAQIVRTITSSDISNLICPCRVTPGGLDIYLFETAAHGLISVDWEGNLTLHKTHGNFRLYNGCKFELNFVNGKAQVREL